MNGSKEEEEIAHRQEPANNRTHCLWEGEYEKVLKERKSVQIYARTQGKQLQAASSSPPTSGLRPRIENKLKQSKKRMLLQPTQGERLPACRRWRRGERSPAWRRVGGDAPSPPGSHARRPRPPWHGQGKLRMPQSWTCCSGPIKAKAQTSENSPLKRKKRKKKKRKKKEEKQERGKKKEEKKERRKKKEEEKKKKKKRKEESSFIQKETKGFSCLLGFFQNHPTALYKRFCNPFLGGRRRGRVVSI